MSTEECSGNTTVADQSENKSYIPMLNKDGDEFTHTIYENKSNPSFTQTRALFIANMNPNMDTTLFKTILEEEAARENCTIERAWLNNNRTHCYVLVSDIPGATSIRARLNNMQINKQIQNTPDEDAIMLYVDYIPVRALDLWIEQERNAPADAIWKITYKSVPSKINVGTSFQKALHEMINYENTDSGYVKSKRRSSRGLKPQFNDSYNCRYERASDRSRTSKSYRHGRTRSCDYSQISYYSHHSRRNDPRGPPRGLNSRSDTYIPDY